MDTDRIEAQNDNENNKEDLGLSYLIDENPPWYMAIMLGLQHYLTMFGATVSLPLILSPAMCVNDPVVTGKLISTIFFVSGVATLLQTCLGNRLPIVQGSTFSYLVPTFAILSLPDYKCPKEMESDPTNSKFDGIWKIRIREIQGAIMVTSIIQIVIGFSGLVGFLLRFIGPITIAPTIALVGLSLVNVCLTNAGSHWGIAFTTIGLIIICSQMLTDVKVPFPFYTKEKGFHTLKSPVFRLFPVIIAIVTTWIFCVILTAAGVFDHNSSARTDVKSSVLADSPWFRVPYPGQWGTPTLSFAGVFGMVAGVIAGVVESIGDYYACARMSGAPPPPPHAINRGIGIEGIACFIAGAFGTGTATTSFSENIGVIGITRVGSRRVVQIGALCMIILALFGKFGALFSTIPQPVIGGVFVVLFGMICAVGLSSLQHVNLNSVRNLFIVGFALIIGLVIPEYLRQHPDTIDTGVPEVNQIFTVLFGTSMVVGGMVALILDNILPGSDEDRGIIKWRSLMTEQRKGTMASIHVYDLPFGITSKWTFAKYIPFLPYYPEDGENDVHPVADSEIQFPQQQQTFL
ncbi:solute carrier family 23 member 2-like isoform X1 [Paramuricea clavata]|uniref:Solute carrier family 23 member 2-like isoform X1 n=1 Tax=Paramuricea clavata TaxID=317549 RepID=A0A7D9HFE2_PARCT|nr:solute carrier family 23 member 2-like isoform X1 [Paramuricea clavata]